ncbi:hypothetical protein D1224_14515 [Henriciella barbarensis]|uniref:Uncharacterized protein n=1 Tax=Henriciella barbarensis TaxID=86342 RepID=A0A399QPD4_9PROT|nr:hypothetical protein [Henriciella barbarensis]RIJ20341.1 hypothetical protein D1224_14515 [Henriciella barbarensis]
MQKVVLRRLYKLSPMIFGLGFLTPLAAQILQSSKVTLPFGMPPLLAGLLIAMAFTIPAQLRGRWV